LYLTKFVIKFCFKFLAVSERVGVRGRQGRTAPFGAWERDGWLAVDLADCLNRFATQFTWDQQKLKYVHCRVGQI